jgi:hypothetical protein
VLDTGSDHLTAEDCEQLALFVYPPRSLITCSTGLADCSPIWNHPFWISTSISQSVNGQVGVPAGGQINVATQ